jgi:serine/threonine protein kinase
VAPRSGSAAADFAWGRDRFIAEGRTLAAFHRVPGVVRVHDFLEANGTAYLVMELVDGRTLLELSLPNTTSDSIDDEVRRGSAEQRAFRAIGSADGTANPCPGTSRF